MAAEAANIGLRGTRFLASAHLLSVSFSAFAGWKASFRAQSSSRRNGREDGLDNRLRLHFGPVRKRSCRRFIGRGHDGFLVNDGNPFEPTRRLSCADALRSDAPDGVSTSSHRAITSFALLKHQFEKTGYSFLLRAKHFCHLFTCLTDPSACPYQRGFSEQGLLDRNTARCGSSMWLWCFRDRLRGPSKSSPDSCRPPSERRQSAFARSSRRRYTIALVPFRRVDVQGSTVR